MSCRLMSRDGGRDGPADGDCPNGQQRRHVEKNEE